MRSVKFSDDQLHLRIAWRESPVLIAKERAGLAWAEVVTLLADGDVPDNVYTEARTRFSTKEIAGLAFAVAEINAWNRL